MTVAERTTDARADGRLFGVGDERTLDDVVVGALYDASRWRRRRPVPVCGVPSFSLEGGGPAPVRLLRHPPESPLSKRVVRDNGRDAAPAARSAPHPIARDAWLRLAACAAAAALLQMDGTIVTVALPSVGRELDVGSHTLAWVLTAYFLAYGLMLFPGGALVDRIGSRRVGLYGLALFAAGAVLGALAGSFGVLVASRLVQGAGAGLVSPASLAGAVSGFPPERRGSALGIWGASSGMANLVGPLVGGLLTVAIDWRACWWFFVPASAAVAWALVRFVPSTVHADESPDPAGLRQRVVAAAALVAALTFVVMIGAFYLAQQYLQSRGRLLGARGGRRAHVDRGAGRRRCAACRAPVGRSAARARPLVAGFLLTALGAGAARRSPARRSTARARCRC